MKARKHTYLMARLLLAFSPEDLWAHGERETLTTDHAVTETEDGLRLELKLTPDAAVVGELATLSASFTRKGRPAGPVACELVFWHIEDQREVFHTRFLSPDGTIEWRHQFFDGAPHRVTLTAEPVSEGSAPVRVRMNIDVEAVHPPTSVVIRTMLFLLGVTALSMAVVFVGAFRL